MGDRGTTHRGEVEGAIHHDGPYRVRLEDEVFLHDDVSVDLALLVPDPSSQPATYITESII
jgi:hypothetical protein